MMDFLAAVSEFEFLRHALLAGLLGGVCAGVVGTWVVVRRSTSVAGAVAHCVLAGLGAARWLQEVHGVRWADPMAGATVAALLAAFIIVATTRHKVEREDTVIAGIWAVGMAIGLLFIAATPGYAEDLMSYLFGNILMVRLHDVWMMSALAVAVVIATVVLYSELQALCFDEEFTQARGLAVDRLSLLLHALTALTVVLLVSVVGIVLVIALLTLPAAIAGRFASTLAGTMALAVLLSVAFTTSGLAVSFSYDLPASAMTIVFAGLAYLVVSALSLRSRRRG